MKQTSPSLTRRRFLKSGAVSLAPLLVSARALGLDGNVSASNRTTVGLIGIGCLGRGHLGNIANNPNVEVLGISDVDQWRLDNGMNIVKNAYKSRTGSDKYRACVPHHDFLDLLARPEIDAVMIVMGDRWHSPAVKLAVQAGKDVFVEKPCALTVDECMTLSQAVRANRRISQVGLQQRSDAYFQYACELVREGRLEKISHVYVVHGSCSREVELPAEPVPPTLDWERWLGPCPWRPWNHRFHYLGYPKNVVPWSFCRDFGNGGIADGGVHAWDVVNWGLQMEYLPGPDPIPGHICVEGKMRKTPQFNSPLEVIPAGTSDQYNYTTFKFPNGITAQIVNSRIDNRVDRLVPSLEGEPVEPFGAIFLGEKGWISVGRRNYLRASSPELIAEGPRRFSENHPYNFIDCVRSRREPNCPIERGCEATLCSTIGSMAVWLNRPLVWDLNKKVFIGDDEANRLRRRTPRGDWIV